MLSYQHIYHAGNLADVHKHMLLADALAYLTRKEKPLTYIETHAGRGFYDLGSEAARKTGEADAGVGQLGARLPTDHPFARVLREVRAEKGDRAYPGSPLLAAKLLRAGDALHFAERHPGEYAALRTAMAHSGAHLHERDGFELAHSLCPPMPRRGLLFIDPSWEIKSDYQDVPRHIARIVRAWNVGIVALWYPLLRSEAHKDMLRILENNHKDILRHEVTFPAARKSHGMIGSGMIFINPPFGLAEKAQELTRLFTEWFPGQSGTLRRGGTVPE